MVRLLITINGYGVLGLFLVICGSCIFATGFTLTRACKTRRDPDEPIKTTYEYVHKMAQGNNSMFFGGILTLLGGFIVSMFNSQLFGLTVACGAIINIQFIVDQWIRIIRNKPISSNDINENDINWLNQTIRKSPEEEV